MKHFFDQVAPANSHMMTEFVRQAREELKQKQMNVSEMHTILDLICFNSSQMNDYVPKGMEQLVRFNNVLVDRKVSIGLSREVNLMASKLEHSPFGFVLGNIQTKGVDGYLDMLFDLKRDFEYEPAVVSHFSDDELLEYLAGFLAGSEHDGIDRRLEVFDDQSN